MNPGKIDYNFSINFIGGNDRNIYGVADWTDLEAKVKWGKYYVFYYFLGFYSDISGLHHALQKVIDINFAYQGK